MRFILFWTTVGIVISLIWMTSIVGVWSLVRDRPAVLERFATCFEAATGRPAAPEWVELVAGLAEIGPAWSEEHGGPEMVACYNQLRKDLP